MLKHNEKKAILKRVRCVGDNDAKSPATTQTLALMKKHFAKGTTTSRWSSMRRPQRSVCGTRAHQRELRWLFPTIIRHPACPDQHGDDGYVGAVSPVGS